MKKLLFKLFFIFAAFVAVAFFSCKNSSDSNDDFYIENPDDKKEENKNPTVTPKPKAKIFVQSKSSHEICIYSDIERQNLVAQIPSNASATFETEQIGEAIFYYTFLISLEQDSGVKVPFYDNSCAFLLATSANEESAQTISFPKSIALSSCFVILKNDGEKAIQFMSENFVISPSKTEGMASAIINPGKSACYEIQKKNFDNLGAYSVRETLGTIAFPLKEKIGAFEECKIYTIIFDGNSIRLANAIGQEELVGMKAYSVTHKCERLDSEEYETSETETLYGFPQEMTEATPKGYEGFVAEDVEQQEIASDGSTQIEIRYKRIRITLTFNANGGTFIDGSETKTLQGKYGAEVSTPTPTWDDHLFLGWDADVPKTFGAEDMAFGSKWNRPLISYTVTHKVESLLNAQIFEEKESETLSGYLGAMTYALPKNYEGFVAEEFVQRKIVRDASIKIEIRYKRIVTTLTFNANGGNFDDGSETKILTGKYGADIQWNLSPSREDYTYFLGWDVEIPKAFPSEDKIFNARWEDFTTKEASDSTVSNVIKCCNDSSYTYTIKLKGGITNSTLRSVAKALYENSSVNFILDLSEAYGITMLEPCSFNYYNPNEPAALDIKSIPCKNLSQIILNDEITKILVNAFYKCTGLTNIEIPNTVTLIGDMAFSGCASLETITIPNSVTSIGSGAFRGCGKLTTITIDVNNPNYSVENAILYNKNKTKLIAYPTASGNVVISNSVEAIGDSAFYSCEGLISVTIPSSVTTIGASAFNGCTNMLEVNIGNGVTTIEVSAFAGCSALMSVTIPASVTKIYRGAFLDSGLESAVFETPKGWCLYDGSGKVIYYHDFYEPIYAAKCLNDPTYWQYLWKRE